MYIAKKQELHNRIFLKEVLNSSLNTPVLTLVYVYVLVQSLSYQYLAMGRY